MLGSKQILKFAVVGMLVGGMVVPQHALADKKPAAKKFTVQSLISGKTIRALNQSASKFNKSGEINQVSFKLPTKDGAAICNVVPHNDSAEANYQAFIVGAKGQQADATKVVQFKSVDAGNDFCRISLVTRKSGKIQKRDILGSLRKSGIVYNLDIVKKSKSNDADAADESVEVKVDEISAADVKAAAEACGVSEALHSHTHDADFENLVSGDISSSEVVSPTAANRVLKFATEADYEYFQKYGANTNARILSMIDSLNGIYSAFNVRFQVVHQRAWSTANDPYTKTAPEPLLIEFKDKYYAYRTTVPGFNSSNPALTHLFTGKNLDGNVIGIAYKGVVCNSSYSYGLTSDFSSQNAVMLVAAHEIGHNFGLDHANVGSLNSNSKPFPANIMASPYSGSNTFEPERTSQAVAYVNSRPTSCLPNDTTNPVMYSINGRVTENSANGAGVAGLTIDGGALGETTTGSDGSYSFVNLPHGASFSLSPMADGETEVYSPAAYSGNLMNNMTVNFVRTVQTENPEDPTTPGNGKSYSLTGYVKFADISKRVPGVTVRVVNDSTGVSTSLLSGSSGQFTFKKLVPGTYSITATKAPGYNISPLGNGKVTIVNKSVSKQIFNTSCASGYTLNKAKRTCDAN